MQCHYSTVTNPTCLPSPVGGGLAELVFPPQPLKRPLYQCGKGFELEPLLAMLADDEVKMGLPSPARIPTSHLPPPTLVLQPLNPLPFSPSPSPPSLDVTTL